jgi:hypothetical protein
MAQVTICGYFTLYTKVDEPTETAPPTAAPENPDEVVAPEAKSAEEGEKASAATEPTAEEPAVDVAQPTNPAETPAEKTEPATAKPEGTTEPKPEPKPEPNEK